MMDVFAFILGVLGFVIIITGMGAVGRDFISKVAKIPVPKKEDKDEIEFFDVDALKVSGGDFVFSAYQYKGKFEAHVRNDDMRRHQWVKAKSEQELKMNIQKVFQEWARKEPNQIIFFLRSIFYTIGKQSITPVDLNRKLR